MLTFLRKIRKSLIESGSARKYLLYAIGEIALVVIGILIALQINNWNELRKSNANQLRLLQGLHNSIQNELNDWEFILNNNYRCDSSYNVIIEYLDNELPYVKSLDKDFHIVMKIWYHELNTSAFETVKGYGLNFIDDQETVDHLSDMYERWHKIYAKSNSDRQAFYNSVAAPYLFNHFERRRDERGNVFIPINYERLLKDQKFRSILEQQEMYRKEVIRWQEDILEDMHESLELLASAMRAY